MHLLSDAEHDLFLQLEAADSVCDIREQFPLPRSETILIAEELGFPHPIANGVLAVMTTDMLVCLKGGRQVAFSVKPASELLKPRVCEKLEIERIYWTRRQVEWVLVSGAKDRDQRLNLQEAAEWRAINDLTEDPRIWDERAADVLMCLAGAVAGRLIDVLRAAEDKHGWLPGTAISACKRLIAKGLVRLGHNGRLDMFGSVSQLVIQGER